MPDVVAIGGALGDEDENSAADHPGVALQAPIEQPEGSARILQRCSHAFDDRDEELAAEPHIFGPDAAMITANSSDGRTVAFIRGTRGQYYAACNLSADGSDDWIHEYDVSAPAGGGQNTLYVGKAVFTYADRFPASMARVRVSLYDGGVVEATAIDGFVTFANRGGVPDRITLVDDSGHTLAAAAWADLPESYGSLLRAARR